MEDFERNIWEPDSREPKNDDDLNTLLDALNDPPVEPAASEEAEDTQQDHTAEEAEEPEAPVTRRAPERPASPWGNNRQPVSSPNVNAWNTDVTRASGKKKRRKASGLGIAAACLVCALLGSLGGGILAGSLVNRKWETVSRDLTGQIASIASAVDEVSAQQTTEPTLPAVIQSVSESDLLSPSQVYAMNVASVVTVTSEGVTSNGWNQSQFTSMGSGFFITQDGYVLTNHHVIENATTVTVTRNDGTDYEAKIIGSDSLNDVALLKIEAENLPCVVIGDSDTLRVGDQVAAIGNPLGTLAFTQTVGYVSAKDRTISGDGTVINMIQTDAAINSGNSGGPLFNMQGAVVGITSAKYSGASSSGASIEGIGFAIPINDAMRLASDLMEYGYITGQAYLGVMVKDIDTSLAAAYGLPVGVYVDSVNEGSCAEKAGMQGGDIITGLGDIEVQTRDELLYALRKFHAGDSTVIHVFRSGQTLDLAITLDEKPRADETESSQPQMPSGQMPDSGNFQDWYNYFAPFFGMTP